MTTSTRPQRSSPSVLLSREDIQRRFCVSSATARRMCGRRYEIQHGMPWGSATSGEPVRRALPDYYWVHLVGGVYVVELLDGGDAVQRVTNYTGPGPWVLCALTGCTNRLRDAYADLPADPLRFAREDTRQWCCRDHREATKPWTATESTPKVNA